MEDLLDVEEVKVVRAIRSLIAVQDASGAVAHVMGSNVSSAPTQDSARCEVTKAMQAARATGPDPLG